MNNILIQVEEQKKKLENNIGYIKENLSKIDGPIFVELIGTPKSGKTTLLTKLTGLFHKNGITYEAKQETAEYNPIENKDLEEYNIWMFMEIMKNISEDTSNPSPRIIVYDRGMLDRIPWLDVAVEDGSIPVEDSMHLKQLFQTKFFQRYKPIAINLITSPEISIKRKGKEGRLVNRKVLQKLNGYLLAEENYMRALASKYEKIQTDSYEGELLRFILDMSVTITEDIKQRLKEIEFGTVGEDTSSIER